MQQNPGMNSYSGGPHSYPTREEHQYTSSKAEGQRKWDRDAHQMSPHLYSGGQGGNVTRPSYPNQMQDTKVGSKQEQIVNSQEQAMEVGYEKSPNPRTLETLDEKFRNDIMKLMTEQDDAEDAENVRHKEKIIEINNQYQEKLSALRARQSTRREKLLQSESLARLKTYDFANVSSYPNNKNPGHHGYGAPDSVPSQPHQQYGSGAQFDPYGQSFGHGRIPGAHDTRVPTPGGRVYNLGSR